MSVEAVLLDAGGVLVMPDDDVIASELAAVGVDMDRSRSAAAHYAGMRGVDQDPGPPPHWRHYTKAYVEVLGITAADADRAQKAVARAFVDMEWIKVITSSFEALPALAERAQLAVVSNSDGTVERVLRACGIGDEMVTILDSHLVGIEKPDPRIFEMALVEIGVPPDRAVHIGDSVRFDIVGARNAGVRPLHLDPFGLCADEDHEHITSLAEVIDLTA
jgi:putative hydrolase of the HAD superfamily